MSKNKWMRIVAAMCVCFMLISFTACGNSSKKGETTTAKSETTAQSTSASQETTAAKEKTDAKEKTAGDSDLVGEWEYESGGFVYTFKDDGSGVYDAGGTVMPFTYTAEGGKLSIIYEGNTEPMVLDYELNGTKLNVKDSLGNDTIYNKK